VSDTTKAEKRYTAGYKIIMTIKRTHIVFGIICTALIATQFACSKYDASYTNVDSEWLSGGQQTVFDEGSGAFAHEFPVMEEHLERVHEIGDVQFEQTFVSAPAPVNPGLGPVFNNVSCASCHIADGRGKVPGVGESAASILFRVSLPGSGEHGEPLPVPGFGDQLQNRVILGSQKEADIKISYLNKSYSFNDGTPYNLRYPTYTITDNYTGLAAGVMLSPRVAAPVIGLGLLEAVSDETILAHADPLDADGDGISGRPNYVWNVVKEQKTLGRFGWKANQPSLLQQVAAAYNGDIGITSFVFPKESSFGQTQYDDLDDDYEISDSLLHSVEFYIKTLAVPVRRNVNDVIVQRGKELFMSTGCASCHLPTLQTNVNVAFPAVSNQTIHPFTDMLLHDMGPDLADNRPDFEASGNEWRTPPLWGIGLTQKVNGHTNFLHDGRARNFLEAIMWHGGEAAASRDKVKALSAGDRAALVKFVESL
jgi:CxxC motif-containing protein (DUF1111 family)